MNANDEDAVCVRDPEANAPMPKTTAIGEASSRLSRLAELASELGSERVSQESSALAERVAEGRFYVACIGQFKRGKSTLLGALVGDCVLPTGVVPITTVPTVLRYGHTKVARVRFHTGDWIKIDPRDLEQYVSEEHNPENRKGVEGVEIFVPSSLLATGMCFVDTPGLGSVFAGNTAATQAFVPHIDAALVVVGADPPIAGEELTLVDSVARDVKDLLVVLNKSDRATDGERAASQAFTKKVLEKRLNRPVNSIFQISAIERLENRGPERDWGKLIEALNVLVSQSGRDLIRTAAERGVRRLGEEIHAIITEEREALLRPIEESERRISSMRQTIAESDRSLRELGYLFTAEQRRLSDLFLDRRKAFLALVEPKAFDEFASAVQKLPMRAGPGFRVAANETAQEIAEHYVLPWLESEQAQSQEEYRKVAARFVDMGNAFLKKLSESGIPELARMPNALDPEKGFRTPSHFTFKLLLNIARPASPLRYIADVFLGLIGATRVIEKEAREFLASLLEINSSRVQFDVVDRVQESRGQLEAEIRKLLLEVSRIAERALDHARTAKAEGASAVKAKLHEIDQKEAELNALLA